MVQLRTAILEFDGIILYSQHKTLFEYAHKKAIKHRQRDQTKNPKAWDVEKIIRTVFTISRSLQLEMEDDRDVSGDDIAWRMILGGVRDMLSSAHKSYMESRDKFDAEIGGKIQFDDWDTLWAAFASSPDVFMNQEFARQMAHYCHQHMTARSDALADQVRWTVDRMSEILL